VTVAIGLDVGTTGARAVAVGEDGTAVASASSPYPILTPGPGWTEQDPDEWWRASLAVLEELCGRLPTRTQVVGVGLTGQMHGSVFLDARGEVIRPALLWNDQRTARQCEDITARIGAARLVEITGNQALTGFQAPKVLWLRDQEPQNFARVVHVLLPKDYVRFRLTGELATDASDASGTLFLDLRTRAWSQEVLMGLEVPMEWLPPVFESPEPTGEIAADVAARVGLLPGVAVAAGGGDNAAAGLGTGITTAGRMSSSIGTSGVLFVHAHDRTIDLSGRVHAFAHAVPDEYCLLAVTLSAGGSLRWWRDVTGLTYEALLAEAADVEPGAEGLVFLPYLTGERTPHLDPAARGAFVGLTARHTRAHLTRALMEGVVFSLRDGLEIIRRLKAAPSDIRAIGGGASSRQWLQLQADVYGQPVRRCTVDEGAAYGAGLLGHIAGGTFRTVEEAAAVLSDGGDVVEPVSSSVKAYNDLYEVYRSLYPATREAVHRLTDLA
jgi:xylulokinase